MVNYSTVVCLISGQPVPNLLSIQHYNPQRVVLVATNPMRERVENIAKCLEQYPNENLTDIIEITLPVSGTVYHEFYHVAEKVLAEFMGNNTIVNVTCGTGVMTLAISDLARMSQSTLCYVNLNDIEEIFPNSVSVTHSINYRMNLKEYLTLYGYKYLETIPPAKNQIDFINDLVPIYEFETYAYFHSLLQQRQHDKLIKNPYYELALKHGVIEQKFLCGGWLEVLLYKELVNILGNSQCGFGVKIYSKSIAVDLTIDELERQQENSNDLDITFVYDNQLYIIECKTSTKFQSAVKIAGAHLYKLYSLQRELGLFAKAYYVINNDVTEGVRKRAKTYNIKVLANVVHQLSIQNIKNMFN